MAEKYGRVIALLAVTLTPRLFKCVSLSIVVAGTASASAVFFGRGYLLIRLTERKLNPKYQMFRLMAETWQGPVRQRVN